MRGLFILFKHGVFFVTVLLYTGCEVPEDHWEECQANLSVYEGCPLTVHALFSSMNRSCLYGTGYSYTIAVNDEEFEDKDVSVEGVNLSSSKCNISATFVVENVDHTVQFSAARIPPDPKVLNKICADFLEIHSSLEEPLNTTANLLCDGIVLTWSAPPVLPGYRINGYNITLVDTALSFWTSNTSFKIPFDEVLTINSTVYDIEISPSYCAGLGNASVVSIEIVNEPAVQEQLNYTVSKYNATHTLSSIFFKVSNPKCPVSHPTHVSASFICNGSIIVDETSNITIDEFGYIQFQFFLPFNQICEGTMKWRNQNPIELITKILISSESLTCGVYSSLNDLAFECSCILSCCIVNLVNTSSSFCSNSGKPHTHCINEHYHCDGNSVLSCEEFVTPSTTSSKIVLTTRYAESCQTHQVSEYVVLTSNPTSYMYEDKTCIAVSSVLGGIIVCCLISLSIVLAIIIYCWCKRKGGGRKTVSSEPNTINDSDYIQDPTQEEQFKQQSSTGVVAGAQQDVTTPSTYSSTNPLIRDAEKGNSPNVHPLSEEVTVTEDSNTHVQIEAEKTIQKYECPDSSKLIFGKNIKPEQEKSNNPIVVTRQKVNVPSTEDTSSIELQPVSKSSGSTQL